jgi:hypothetical protein
MDREPSGLAEEQSKKAPSLSLYATCESGGQRCEAKLSVGLGSELHLPVAIWNAREEAMRRGQRHCVSQAGGRTTRTKRERGNSKPSWTVQSPTLRRFNDHLRVGRGDQSL